MNSQKKFQAELDHFEKVRATLVSQGHEGKYAVVYEQQVIYIMETYADAIGAGYGIAGLDTFLVKQITQVDVPILITRLLGV